MFKKIINIISLSLFLLNIYSYYNWIGGITFFITLLFVLISFLAIDMIMDGIATLFFMMILIPNTFLQYNFYFFWIMTLIPSFYIVVILIKNKEENYESLESTCQCNKCSYINNCNDKFCINCGSVLSTEHQEKNESCICGHCNTTNNCNDKYCTSCGNKLENINSQLYTEILNSIDGIVVALLSKIAKADGRISQEEATYLSGIFDTLAEKKDDEVQAKKIYKEILKQEKDKLENIDEFCEKLSYTNAPKDLKIEIVKIFMELAYIDSVYDKTEENIIVKIVHHLDLDFSIYQNIKNEFEPKNENTANNSNTINLTLDECYVVLESTKSDTMVIIKKNYRRLIKQYHYDSMASKDLPQDMLKFAEEKAKIINAAYEKVKKNRG